MSPKKILFVINPISGGLDKEDAEAQIEAFCQTENIDAHIYKTSGDDDATKVLNLYLELKPAAVVAAGGDGTVNLVGTMLIDRDTPMGILPLGSGNGLSKDLKIPQDFGEALQIIRQFNVVAIDTLLINDKPSLHLSDLGFNAQIVKRFDEGDTRGPAAYAWHVMREYVGYQPKEYEVITDQDHYQGKAFMVAIANANMFGSNATINPLGIINDGIFEICILEEFPKLEGISILYQLFNAEIHNSLRSRVLHCRKATIINLEKELIQIDGEPIEAVEKIEVKIRPQSLKVLLPTDFKPEQSNENALSS
jgi:YegS/Rv2252/BmrU family lipid kinase